LHAAAPLRAELSGKSLAVQRRRADRVLLSIGAMQPLPNLFGRASAVEADHAHLRAAWTRLQNLVRGPHTASSSTESWPLINEFVLELRAHFAAEEEGYFDTLVELRPGLSQRVEGLRSDHAAILGLLDELLALETRPEPHGELEPRLALVLVRLERHEHEETSLLQEFFARVEDSES
jgi:hypothetical protein